MRRSLTAVLAADVVGYSRMMSANAEATLRRLRSEILGPVVAAKRGRVVKSMGDGWIFTFEAVTDAVEAAMQAQERLKIDGQLADSFDWQDRAARWLTARTFEAILAAQMDAFQHLPEDALTAEQLTLLTLYDVEFSGSGRRKLMHRLVRLIAKAPDQSGPYAHAAANQISAEAMGFADAVAEFTPLLPVWMEKLDQHAGQVIKRHCHLFCATGLAG
jgi:hypothetical protein